MTPDALLLPDVETLVVFALKDDADLTALTERRVSTKLERDWPMVTITLTGGRMAVEGILAAPTLDYDAWASSAAVARDLAYKAQRALHRMVGRHALGVVTRVEDVLLPRQIAEDKADRAHYTGEVRVFVRPLHQ